MRASRDEVAEIVAVARELIAAHERRNPATTTVTESEHMALAHLSYTLHMLAREHEAGHRAP